MGKVADKITGFLEVGTNGRGEVVINHSDIMPDENGVGHIVFSPNQARDLARVLSKQADRADLEALYEVGPNGAWIRCLICNMTSYNPNDVAQRYCGNCHLFHTDAL